MNEHRLDLPQLLDYRLGSHSAEIMQAISRNQAFLVELFDTQTYKIDRKFLKLELFQAGKHEKPTQVKHVTGCLIPTSCNT